MSQAVKEDLDVPVLYSMYLPLNAIRAARRRFPGAWGWGGGTRTYYNYSSMYAMIDVRGSEAIVEDDQANRRATYACGCCTQGSPDRFSARICVNLPRIRPVVCFIGCDPLPRSLGRRGVPAKYAL